MALLSRDFDNFKGINDSHGHAAGDPVLTTTADRIKATIRQHDRAGPIAPCSRPGLAGRHQVVAH